MNYMKYRKELGVELTETEKEKFCMNLMMSRLHDLEPSISELWNQKLDEDKYRLRITSEEYINFCELVGLQRFSFGRFDDFVTFLAKQTDVFLKFVAYYISFINCLADVNPENNDTERKEKLIAIAKECIEKSELEYEVVQKDNEYFIYRRKNINPVQA